MFDSDSKDRGFESRRARFKKSRICWIFQQIRAFFAFWQSVKNVKFVVLFVSVTPVTYNCMSKCMALDAYARSVYNTVTNCALKFQRKEARYFHAALYKRNHSHYV